MEARSAKVINLMSRLIPTMKFQNGESWQAACDEALLFDIPEEAFDMLVPRSEADSYLVEFQQNLILRAKEDRSIVWRPDGNSNNDSPKLFHIYSFYNPNRQRANPKIGLPKTAVYEPDLA